MKVWEYLSRAGECKSVSDVESLLGDLAKAMKTHPFIEGLTFGDVQAALDENENAHFVFCFKQALSNDYHIAIRVILFDGNLEADIGTWQAMDRLGMGSANLKPVYELDGEIEARPQWEIEILTQQVVEEVIRQHADLMERAGVSRFAANAIAQVRREGGAA